MTANVDTLIVPRWVVPVCPSGAALTEHAVAIAGGRIAGVLPAADAQARFPGAKRVLLPKHALIPGLINLHTPAPMALMRGFADDRALMQWLKPRIWPAEMKLVSREFVRDGTLLACAEMIAGGV